MNTRKQLLIVGGTGRNVGKTEFICRLIQRISLNVPVYAIKVSAQFPEEEIYHGNHSADESEFHVFEETNRTSDKDTSRMLRAGAVKVFYLRSDDRRIEVGFENLVKHIPQKAAVVCESNSLGKFVKPAISIIVRPVIGPIKPRAIPRLKSADLVVVSDGANGFSEIQSIRFSSGVGWQIKTKPGLIDGHTKQ